MCDVNNSMGLNAATMKHLEILNNNFDRNSVGSLWDVINMTNTKFGARMLRKWLCHPSKVRDEILERHNAVDEIIRLRSRTIVVVGELLKHLPDLDRGITSIFHLKVCEILTHLRPPTPSPPHPITFLVSCYNSIPFF